MTVIEFADFENAFKCYCTVIKNDVCNLNAICPQESSPEIMSARGRLKRHFRVSSFTYMNYEKVSEVIAEKQLGWVVIVSTFPRHVFSHLERVLMEESVDKFQYDAPTLSFNDRPDWNSFIEQKTLHSFFHELYDIINKDIIYALKYFDGLTLKNERSDSTVSLFDQAIEDGRKSKSFDQVEDYLSHRSSHWKQFCKLKFKDFLGHLHSKLYEECKEKKIKLSDVTRTETINFDVNFVVYQLNRHVHETEEEKELVNELFTTWEAMEDHIQFPPSSGIFSLKTVQAAEGTYIGLAFNLQRTLDFDILKQSQDTVFANFIRRHPDNLMIRYRISPSFLEAKALFENLKVLLKF